MDEVVFALVVAAVRLLAVYVIRVINRYEYAPTLSRDFTRWYKEEIRESPQTTLKDAVMYYLEDEWLESNSGSLEEES